MILGVFVIRYYIMMPNTHRWNTSRIRATYAQNVLGTGSRWVHDEHANAQLSTACLSFPPNDVRGDRTVVE